MVGTITVSLSLSKSPSKRHSGRSVDSRPAHCPRCPFTQLSAASVARMLLHCMRLCDDPNGKQRQWLSERMNRNAVDRRLPGKWRAG